MPVPLVVLLPPSETKRIGGSRTSKIDQFDDRLADARRDVKRALRVLLRTSTPQDLERTLHVRGALLARATSSTQLIVTGRAPLMPAWQRYAGVVWTHVDPATLLPSERQRLLVPSGLYGVTTAEDDIADYRLKMNATLATVGGLARFWRARLTTVVADHCHGALVVNLVPKEHEAALDLNVIDVTSSVITVAFLGPDGQGVSGHAAKAVKGVLARQLVTEGVNALDNFQWAGWRAQHRSGVTNVVAPRE